MNLSKLFEIQRNLDDHIEREHPRRPGEERLVKKILALQVELGELANCWRGFKYWSNDQEPRIKDYKQVKCKWCNGSGDDGTGVCPDCKSLGDVYKEYNPLLEEYVDCLHFILSIGNDLGIKVTTVEEVQRTDITFVFNELFDIVSRLRNIHILRGYEYIWLLKEFINLSKMLGFTWEQVEQAYLEKNKINHERQVNGY